jgi:serine/threonine-protein kinase
MLVGQPFGPFVIDKELGSGAMGAVYRGRYTKTGQVVAIKIMAPGLGTTNSRAADRFVREAEILKQLKHPNIVHLFGVGKSQGTRYLAMEYIDGESLDKVMARRNRMSWEEVINLGRDLCSALQHAHEKGIIHRDLKPSNLMVLRDGTLKLTDFGIAKDLDVTQLTSANCTVGTAAYMSPEQCKGERDLSPKSDLYSLGVVLYELVTGRKPFNAENAMDMFLQHVSGPFERPSRLVLDLPVWLDNLICQLLEKKPDQRPLDAAMVATVLASIKEKAEAQHSAGVEAAKRRMVDRMPGQPKADEKDKEAARFLLKGKVRSRRKKQKLWYEKVWVRAVGLGTVLAGVLFAIGLALRPASPDELYDKAVRMRANGKEEEALAGPIKEYLDRYGGQDLPHTKEVREWADEADRREGEALLANYRGKALRGKGQLMDTQNDDERLAFKAVDQENRGDVTEARREWQGLAQPEHLHRWQVVAAKHLADLQAQEDLEKQFRDDFQKTQTDGVDRTPEDGFPRQAFLALRYDNFGDRQRAKTRFAELKRSTAEKGQNLWFLLAARKFHELDLQGEHNKESQALLEEKLEKIRPDTSDQALGERLWKAYAACLDIVALYGGNAEPEDIKQLAGEARKLLQKMAKRLERKLPPWADTGSVGG